MMSVLLQSSNFRTNKKETMIAEDIKYFQFYLFSLDMLFLLLLSKPEIR